MSAIGYNDPAAISLTIGGMRIDQFGRGQFLVVKFNADRYNLLVGANGDATRSRMHDRSAKIHIKMLASATQNAIFHAMVRADDREIFGGLPVTINDFLNNKRYVCDLAWINRSADDPIGAVDGEEREWVLETYELVDDYAPPVIQGLNIGGGLELIAQIAAEMAARFAPT